MSSSCRICLFETRATFKEPFRTPFERISGVEIVDECRDWGTLQEHLRLGVVDVIAINLDHTDNQQSLQTVQRIAEISPNIPLLGVSANTAPNNIIAAMRAGCGQFVAWPVDLNDLREALNRVRRSTLPSATGCQRICVVGSSGGSGATTIACNLALELAQLAETRCALVDLNLQFGDVACSFDISPKHSLSDICTPGLDIDRTLIETAMEHLPCNVSLLSRPDNLEQAQEIAADSVLEMFRIMEQMYPFIVVDLPRHFGAATMATLDGADRVCIVTQLVIPHLRNAVRMYEYLVGMGADESRIDIVLNRSKANHERIKQEEVERQFARPVFAVVPNDYKHIGASRDLGHPLMSNAPSSPARLAIRAMAQKVIAANQNGDRRASRSVLGVLRTGANGNGRRRT